MSAAEAGPDIFLPGGMTTLSALFAPFRAYPRVLLAVSGGPDSCALLWLANQWCTHRGEEAVPELFVATVDHGLRPEARQEAERVGILAGRFGLPHAVLDLPAALPASGLQEAARHARYGVLHAHARRIGAPALATAHTLDDQAETVMFRLMRGSGVSGLAGMSCSRDMDGIALLRPLLGLPKTELVRLCRHAEIAFAEDPSNHNPRFARARLRALMPKLALEGLDATGLARLASRMARADAALEAASDAAVAAMRGLNGGEPDVRGRISLDRVELAALPDEISLRVLGRMLMRAAGGTPELGKLEALHDWFRGLGPQEQGARTLAGALVRVGTRRVTIASAPARRNG